MKTRLLILCALCLTACARREQNNLQPTLPAPSVVVEIEMPTHTPQPSPTPEPSHPAPASQAVQPTLAPTLDPTVTPPPSTATLTPVPSPTPVPSLSPQAETTGDQLEGLLGQLEATNTAADSEINSLIDP